MARTADEDRTTPPRPAASSRVSTAGAAETPAPPTQPAGDDGGDGGHSGRYGTFASLAYRNYRYLWLGQASHAASMWMEQIARPWLVLLLTNDNAAHVGGVVAMRTVPMLFLGVWAGVIADHFDRKTILQSTKLGVFLLNAAFAAILIAGQMELWMIYVASFIRGSFMAFDQPARQSMIASIVPRELLTNGVALMSSTQNIMRIVGVFASGILISALGINATFVVITVVVFGSVLATALLDVPTNRDPSVKTTWAGMRASLREGFMFALSQPAIRGVVLLSVVFYAFAMTWMQVFAPLFARTVMETGAVGLSVITATSAVGALVGTFTIASVYPKALGRILPLAICGMGAALIVFSVLTYLPGTLGIVLPLLAIAVVGLMQTSYMSLSNATMLAAATDEMRGRVMSVLSLSRAMVSLGAAGAGLLAAAIGAQAAQIVFGCIVVAGGLLMLVFARGFRDYRTP